MIHYSCDRCRRSLESDELRYVVRLEIAATMDSQVTDDWEDDRDHLMEVHEILDEAESLESELIGADIHERRKFDLCPECYRKFVRNPLGCEVASSVEFSDN